MSTTHLSDEQFGQLLAGETADPATKMHLESCAICRGELESVRSAVGDLGELSLRWAEQRAGRVQVPPRWSLRWHAVPGWSAAVAVLLFCGVAIGVHEQAASRSHIAMQISRSQPAPAPTEDELAQDNRLLRSIDDELSEQVRPQVPPSELTASARTARRPISREVAN